MAHPWHDVALPPADKLASSFPVVVEISKGSKNKYELDKEHGVDAKIIAVHVNDPIVRDDHAMRELPQHVVVEIRRFFEDYKVLEDKPVAVGADLDRDEAVALLRAAAERYLREHP